MGKQNALLKVSSIKDTATQAGQVRARLQNILLYFQTFFPMPPNQTTEKKHATLYASCMQCILGLP